MMKRKVVQYTRDGYRPLRLFNSIREAEHEYNITHISSVCRGKRRTDGGYVWRYIEEVVNDQ